MRRILVDFARARHYAKRGGAAQQVSLDEAVTIHQDRSAEIIALDEALKSLGEIDPRKSQIVELRFFGGLSAKETAEALKVSQRTVEREWNSARAWLYRELRGKDES
jgi:RNA polymerase sigma factor (TIGR02999 family)